MTPCDGRRRLRHDTGLRDERKSTNITLYNNLWLVKKKKKKISTMHWLKKRRCFCML